MSHEANPLEVAEVFRTFYEDPTNCKCMDCGLDAGEWISVNNAVSLCGNCAAAHSHFNDHISIIRQIQSPDWEWKDLMLLRNGGNMKFKLFMDEFKIDVLANPLVKYKTKAAFYYRRKLRHLCEGKPAPKAPSMEEAHEEVEHDNFLDKISDFFTGLFHSEKQDNLEAHPGPLVEETQAHGLLAPRIEASEGLKSDSFRPELQPKDLPAKEIEPVKEFKPAQDLIIEGKQLPIANNMQGNYEKKDWMPSQQTEEKPSQLSSQISKELKKGEKDLHKVEGKEIGEAKSTFEKIRDTTDQLLQEGLDKLKEGVHKGAELLKGKEEERELNKAKDLKEEGLKKQDLNQRPFIQKSQTTPIEEKAPESNLEEKEPELDLYRVLRHSKTKEMLEHQEIVQWKHQMNERELQSLAGEAAEEIKARVLPTTTKSRAAQIAQQAAMVEAARGMTKISKGEGCEHEVKLHAQVDYEYMEKLQELAKDKKTIEKETTIEEVRKSEDFGVPEVFRANIKRLASTAPEPTGDAKPQKILSLNAQKRREARLLKKKQKAELQAQRPDHTKLTEHPIDITLSPLEKKIQMKQFEGFLLSNDMLQKSYDLDGHPSPDAPRHSKDESLDFFGNKIYHASTAHMQPETQKSIRRKHFHKQIHKKEEETTEEQGEKGEKTTDLKAKWSKKALARQEDRKLSITERFKQKLSGSFEIAKEKMNETLGLTKDSPSLYNAAKEKLEHLKEKASEKLEAVKDSKIMVATTEKFEHAKEKLDGAVEWIKEKIHPAAVGKKVAEPDQPAPEAQTEQPAELPGELPAELPAEQKTVPPTEQTENKLKPNLLNEQGEFVEKHHDMSKAEKELFKERLVDRH